jgi:phosphate transport system substrate-binding protein
MEILGRMLCRIALVLAITIAAVAAQAAEISGAGATFPYPLYAKWAAVYNAATGIRVNYQSIGSGGGIKQIKARTVDFGASDMPLEPQALAKAGLVQWPMIMGGIVVVANLPGIGAGQLTLDGPTLAAIYLGKIISWNDPAIARLNPGLALPKLGIAVIDRSDGSGTTFVFTDYLSKVSAEWRNQVGESTAVEWPAGLGAKGNEGVAAIALRTAGAIGYVEYAYALQTKLAYVKLVNRAGEAVAPGIKSFEAAAANADWANAPGFHVVLTDQPGKASWPIMGVSFILMHERQAKPATATQVLDFFDWAFRNGDAMAESLGYVPMPGKVVSTIESTWGRITGPDGKPVWTGPHP